MSVAVKPPWMIRTRSMRFVALVVVFAIFSAVVASGITFGVDDGASRYFKSVQGTPALDAVMVAFSSMGDVTTLFILGIILTIIRRTRKSGLIFLIALVIVVIVVMYIKPVVGRQNPPYGFKSALKLPDNFIESDSVNSPITPLAETLSYPSGHAARTTALVFITGFVIYQKSKKASYAFWVFPIIVGISRLYVMQHYPTDIIGGFLLGGIVSVPLTNAMKLDQPFSTSRFKGSEDQAQSSGNL